MKTLRIGVLCRCGTGVCLQEKGWNDGEGRRLGQTVMQWGRRMGSRERALVMGKWNRVWEGYTVKVKYKYFCI